jgi:hypothetical protein
VRGIANSLRQLRGEPLRKPSKPEHIVNEDESIRNQFKTLREENPGNKVMTAEQVKKNRIRMYGEPAEDLPETESPPPVFYKTIEPTKKKESG